MHTVIAPPSFTQTEIWSAWHRLFSEVRQVAHKPGILWSSWPTPGTVVPQPST